MNLVVSLKKKRKNAKEMTSTSAIVNESIDEYNRPKKATQ
jgi:hypothetical protein